MIYSSWAGGDVDAVALYAHTSRFREGFIFFRRLKGSAPAKTPGHTSDVEAAKSDVSTQGHNYTTKTTPSLKESIRGSVAKSKAQAIRLPQVIQRGAR